MSCLATPRQEQNILAKSRKTNEETFDAAGDPRDPEVCQVAIRGHEIPSATWVTFPSILIEKTRFFRFFCFGSNRGP
jgi:hypothetical protein